MFHVPIQLIISDYKVTIIRFERNSYKYSDNSTNFAEISNFVNIKFYNAYII